MIVSAEWAMDSGSHNARSFPTQDLSCAFHGIAIWMYWNEGAHARPQFHARSGEHLASVDFTGEIIAGELPTREHRFVREWCGLHVDELTENWRRVIAEETASRHHAPALA